MRILIISPIFSPSNRIAAIRWTKIAKYLSLQGHDVTVISAAAENTPIQDDILVRDADALSRVVCLENSKLYKAVHALVYGGYKAMRKPAALGPEAAGSEKGGSAAQGAAKENGIKSRIRRWLLLFKDLDFARQACRYLKTHDIGADKLVTTYGPFAGHLVGKYYKKRHPSVKWIADFRDSVQYVEDKNEMGIFARWFLQNTQRKADLMMAVSEGLSQELSCNRKSQCVTITNGFDTEDLLHIERTHAEEIHSLHLCYCGTIYGHRDLSPLFCAIRGLINEEKMMADHVKFHYAGDSFSEISSKCEQYKLENIIVNHGVLPRSKSLELQSQSGILVLASWNTQNQQGVLSGKLLEYMMHKKPIIALVSGDKKNSEIKRIIAQGSLGFCYEQANGEKDFEELKSFVMNAYTATVKGIQILSQPDYDFIARYDYKSISKEVEQLLLQ